MTNEIEQVLTWLPLRDVPAYIKEVYGRRRRYTRQTIYNWAKWGWLQTKGRHPKQTTKIWVRQCITQYITL